jgi:glycosyltransferase involved in cell wall biosynthesis
MSKWLILICTLPERANKLKRLTLELDRQKSKFPGTVDYKIHDAGRSVPTGTKRNMLIEQSYSEYFSFIDDDDQVSDKYVDLIMKALEANPDVVTFNGWYTEFGANRRNFTIRLGSKYCDDAKHPEFYYHRFPNHLAVFKRSVVERIKFPPIWKQEDYQWAKQIADRKLLKTEVHIPEMLYWYDYNPKPQQHARVRR